LDIVQKLWTPLRKLFATPDVPSWLRACASRVSLVFEGHSYNVTSIYPAFSYLKKATC